MLLIALYSSNQVQEQMTWFWASHFSGRSMDKGMLRALVGDYDEQAIRPHQRKTMRES